MWLTSKVIVLMLLFATAQANTNKIGNGGNLVVCDKQMPLLLDFYENQTKTPESKERLHTDVAIEVLNKISEVAPKLAKQYRERLKTIESEIEFKDGVILATVRDSFHIERPKDCAVVQVAIRKAKTALEEKQFLFRKDLWEKLDPVNKAGLLLHEIIYEHLSKLGENDSRSSRRLNAYLFSSKSDKNGFWPLVKELRIPIYP